jgi:hypothetical protein
VIEGRGGLLAAEFSQEMTFLLWLDSLAKKFDMVEKIDYNDVNFQ